MAVMTAIKRLWPLVLIGLLSASSAGHADSLYQSPEDFVRSTFGAIPEPSLLWLTKSHQEQISHLLGHPYPQARLRYWRQGAKSVWILDEIGKEYPITAGFIIQERQIARAQVLIYRETRGQEIHLPSFLAQFTGNSLQGDTLERKIDALAGATLSVNAMVKMAQLALLLDQLSLAEIKPGSAQPQKPDLNTRP
jgi:hypothetical protein